MRPGWRRAVRGPYAGHLRRLQRKPACPVRFRWRSAWAAASVPVWCARARSSRENGETRYGHVCKDGPVFNAEEVEVVMADLRVNFCGVQLKNPITTASGTFGFGHEYGEFFDLSQLGGIGVKGLTPTERLGNPAPRIAETPQGILNCVGLQQPGY